MTPPSQHQESGFLIHRIIVTIFLIILLLPIAATLGYSLATEWNISFLPKDITLEWFAQLWAEPRFLLALGRSIFVCVASIALTLLLVLPMAFVVHYRLTKLKPVINVLILMPFVVPPIISSVGLMQLFAESPIPMLGTPWILIGCHFTVMLPFVYRAISTSLDAVNLHELMDAAHLLGASSLRALLIIIIPSIRTGIVVATLLSFSLLMGEFVFANLLAGTQYETVQVYLYSLRGRSGHLSSALVISYFFVILLLTLLTQKLTKSKELRNVLS